MPRIRAHASNQGSCLESGLMPRIRAHASNQGSCLESGLMPRIKAHASNQLQASDICPGAACALIQFFPSIPKTGDSIRTVHSARKVSYPRSGTRTPDQERHVESFQSSPKAFIFILPRTLRPHRIIRHKTGCLHHASDRVRFPPPHCGLRIRVSETKGQKPKTSTSQRPHIMMDVGRHLPTLTHLFSGPAE